MVSRKRVEPFTPGTDRGDLQNKRIKDLASPHGKTPLRNVMTPNRKGSGAVVHSSSKKPAADVVGAGAMIGSASRSRLASGSIDALTLNEPERRERAEVALQKGRTRKANLMSPVVNSSPKAALPQSFSSATRTLRKDGKPAGNTPVGSVIAGESSNRPLPGSNGKPKMTAEQMNRVFEEWIKIAADNVSIHHHYNEFI